MEPPVNFAFLQAAWNHSCVVAKVFRGGAEGELVKRMQRLFRTVKHMKPAASRPESSEMYVIAQGFRPEVAAAERARQGGGAAED